MPILLYNLSWMPFNALLAIGAVLLAYVFLRTKNWLLKVILGVSWLLFLPNTIYIVTDLVHLIHQWPLVDWDVRMVLLIQFGILEIIGFVTFILAYRPFEVMLRSYKLPMQKKVWVIIIFNFLIGFGMVLGRVERINSWDVIVSFDRVVAAVVQTMTSPLHLGLFLLFGLFCNFFYFLFRDPIRRSTIRLAKKLAD